MTVREIVETVIKDLGGINVPVSMLDNIGIPIARAIQGLQLCVDAWNEDDAKQDQKLSEDNDDVQLELVSTGEISSNDSN